MKHFLFIALSFSRVYFYLFIYFVVEAMISEEDVTQETKFYRKKYMKYYLNLAKVNLDADTLTRFYEKGQQYHLHKLKPRNEIKPATNSLQKACTVKPTNHTQSESYVYVRALFFNEAHKLITFWRETCSEYSTDDLVLKVICLWKGLHSCWHHFGLATLSLGRFSCKTGYLFVFLLLLVLIKTNLLFDALFSEIRVCVAIKQLFDEMVSFHEPDIYAF